jgi:hypothetical protein
MNFANNTPHMLLILIPIAWLTVVTLFVAICRTAARGDAAPERPAAQPIARAVGEGLLLWEDPLEVTLQDKRRRNRGRLTAHGVR